MRFVPSRVSEIVDYLSYLVVYYPNDFPSEDGVDAGSAVATLEEGLLKTRAALGEVAYGELLRMSAEAKRLYDQGDRRAGAFMFQDMQALLRRKRTPR